MADNYKTDLANYKENLVLSDKWFLFKKVQNGLLEEAKKIYDTKIRTKAVLTPIGYKELFDYFDNKCSFEEAIELIKQRSRRYAKRQYTWNRHQFDLKWFNVDFENFDNTIDEVYKYIKNNE